MHRIILRRGFQNAKCGEERKKFRVIFIIYTFHFPSAESERIFDFANTKANIKLFSVYSHLHKFQWQIKSIHDSSLRIALALAIRCSILMCSILIILLKDNLNKCGRNSLGVCFGLIGAGAEFLAPIKAK